MRLSHVEMVKVENPGSVDAMRLLQHGNECLVELQLEGSAYILRYWSC